uniref:Uncharacterized protein n=1 Tax=Pipistrellus kuhlii TaxID=59472 RepID=A0A7J7RDX4_PIPKU|nr:hypothetical protein mPipKuh1_010677 [Pipistrellus kuhlii]
MEDTAQPATSVRHGSQAAAATRVSMAGAASDELMKDSATKDPARRCVECLSDKRCCCMSSLSVSLSTAPTSQGRAQLFVFLCLPWSFSLLGSSHSLCFCQSKGGENDQRTYMPNVHISLTNGLRQQGGKGMNGGRG